MQKLSQFELLKRVAENQGNVVWSAGQNSYLIKDIHGNDLLHCIGNVADKMPMGKRQPGVYVGNSVCPVPLDAAQVNELIRIVAGLYIYQQQAVKQK